VCVHVFVFACVSVCVHVHACGRVRQMHLSNRPHRNCPTYLIDRVSLVLIHAWRYQVNLDAVADEEGGKGLHDRD
jgi:hypothetical protein